MLSRSLRANDGLRNDRPGTRGSCLSAGLPGRSVVQRLRGLLKLHQFVAVAVWLDDTVLGVRHSYKPGLTLLYGGAGWRENHRLAAARELQEEVGITIDPDTLRLVMATPNMHLYELRLTEKPELQIDRREIVEACFMHPGGLREARHRHKIGEYLARGGRP